MEFFNLAIFRLGIGLLLLILANIALGSINAFIEGTWDSAKFRNGCIKGGVIAAALIAVYFAGWLNPDLLVIENDGQTVNLMTAVHLALLAAFTIYAVDVIAKLKNMLTTTTPGTDETTRSAALDIPVPDTPEAVEADPVGEEGNAYDPY